MNKQFINKYLKYEDLNAELKQVADIIGMVKTKELMFAFEGTPFYIPCFKNIEPFMLRLLQDKKSDVTKNLAKELGVSQTFIRNKLKIIQQK